MRTGDKVYTGSDKSELCEEICERIAMGESLVSIVSDTHMPTYNTVMRWLRSTKNFLDSYVEAHVAQGDATADKVIYIADKVLVGMYEPQAARVAIDALKWASGKRNAKKYGDKIQLAGNDLGPILHADATKLTDDQLASIITATSSK